MHDLIQLQFKRMTRDAQLAAVRRLALCGATAEQIARHTGWEIQEVQRALRDPAAATMPSQRMWARPRRAGSQVGVTGRLLPP